MAGITITPPTDYNLASPQIGVEIWPHNGGAVSFSGAQSGILQAQITKNIRDRNGGKFVLHLAPGGPNGVADSTSWTSILTPASLVIIYLSRGGSQRIVMMGILNSVEESQIWQNNRVIRTIKIQGCDFTYFFNAFSYYTLTYLGFLPSLPAPAAGWVIGRFKGQFYGTPDSVAVDWLGVMLGNSIASHNLGILSQTYVTYQGNQIFLSQLFSYWFEAFVEAELAYMPFYADYFNSEGSWSDRFYAMLTWPYYEFFITTAEVGDYPDLGLIANSRAFGNSFGYAQVATSTINVANYNPVSPTIVGRVNPLPWVAYPQLGGVQSAINRSRWDELNTYTLGAFSFIDSTVQYNSNDAFNFFGVNTMMTNAIAAQAGTSNANLFGVEILGAIIDPYGIKTYGFRPYYNQVRWLTLPPTAISKPNTNFNIANTADTLLGKLASYYIPSPNLLDGTITIPMWPDVLPGNKFLYNPFKNTNVYEFYIEGVTHTYVFGGRSKTTLNVGRGALLSDYNDPNILPGMHLDSYVRVNGVFTARTDIATTPPAYHILIGTATSAGIGVYPYYSSPKNILPNTNPSPPALGWPPGTNNSYDNVFMNAVSLTPCGSSLDWRLVKALAMTESSISLQQSAVNGTSVGIMQVNTAAHPEYNAALLASSSTYNINSGTTIFCNYIQAYPNDLLNAMAAYKGFANKGGYANPHAKSPVDLAIKYATEAGVPNLP